MKTSDLFFKVFVIICFSAFLSIGFLQKEEQQVKAEQFSNLVCDQIIPVGEAAEEVKEIMDIVFQEYKESASDIMSATKYLTEVIALLSDNDEVCDFTKCKPQVDDIGPDLTLKYTAIIKSGEIAGAHLPLCVKDGGVGEPCPVIDEHVVDTFSYLKKSLNGSGKNIHDLFSIKTEFVTEETKHEGETPYETKITRLEAAQRILELVDMWLTPSVGTMKSCALSELDKKKVRDGKMGDVFPIQCAKAIEEGYYWPRAWSDDCVEECQEEVTKECKECLGRCEGKSTLAKINCVIYNKTKPKTCGSMCDKGPTEDCLSCLCSDGLGHPLSNENCIAWLCGNYYNWVCCHETSLKQD